MRNRGSSPCKYAGFTQFLLGGRGDQTRLGGVAVEHEVSDDLFVGWQADSRRTERIGTAPFGGAPSSVLFTLREQVQQGYLYWLPLEQLSFSARYERGRYRSQPVEFLGYEDLNTTRLPLEVRYFGRSGLTTGVRASHVQQDGFFPSARIWTVRPPDACTGAGHLLGRRRVRRLSLAESPGPLVAECRQLAGRDLPIPGCRSNESEPVS